MKKIPKWLKILSIIFPSIILGAVVCGFLIFFNSWYPTTMNIVKESNDNVSMKAIFYRPVFNPDKISDRKWFWEKNRITRIILHDWKNDGPEFKINLRGVIEQAHLIHGGEKLAVLNVRTVYLDDPEIAGPGGAYSEDSFYLLHRVPKAEGDETIEKIIVPERKKVIAISPNEDGYFAYSTRNKILTKFSWDNEKIADLEFPDRFSHDGLPTINFFDNGNKLAFQLYNHNTQESMVYIWNLNKNTTNEIIIDRDYPGFLGSKLQIEQDGNLYLERAETSIKRIKIYE